MPNAHTGETLTTCKPRLLPCCSLTKGICTNLLLDRTELPSSMYCCLPTTCCTTATVHFSRSGPRKTKRTPLLTKADLQGESWSTVTARAGGPHRAGSYPRGNRRISIASPGGFVTLGRHRPRRRPSKRRQQARAADRNRRSSPLPPAPWRCGGFGGSFGSAHATLDPMDDPFAGLVKRPPRDRYLPWFPPPPLLPPSI